jgi:hypothetical protein
MKPAQPMYERASSHNPDRSGAFSSAASPTFPTQPALTLTLRDKR